MAEIPGNVFSRHLSGPMPSAARADGTWIEDTTGKRYLDASGGAVVVNLGHGLTELAEAVKEQILKCHYAHPTMFTTPVVEELAGALAAHAPSGIERFYFMSTGSEAVETAVKLARQIHLANGRAQRVRLISRWKSYHGLTLGALAGTGRTSFRAPYTPMLNDAVHIPPAYCLRCPFGLTYPDCGLRCAEALEWEIENLGEDVVSAFLAEPISGASLAGYAAPPGYWKRIREICDRHGVLLIHDEIMTGMGRTGRWFASEHDGIAPDLVTLGKGLTAGAIGMSAVGVRREHYEAVRRAGSFAHGGTFSHHPVAASAALTVVRILERDNLVQQAETTGLELGRRLKRALGEHPYVGEVRGVGMLRGVEFVKDKASLTPFPRKDQVTERLWNRLFERGVILYKSTALAGVDGDALVVAPPFIIGDEDMTLLIEELAGALDHVLGK